MLGYTFQNFTWGYRSVYVTLPVNIPLYPEFAIRTTARPSFHPPISYLQIGRKKSVNEINMEIHYAIFTVWIPLSFKLLGWNHGVIIVKILRVKEYEQRHRWQRLIIIVIYWKRCIPHYIACFNNPMKLTQWKSLGIVVLGC